MKKPHTLIPGFPVVAIVAVAMAIWSMASVDPVQAAGDPIVVIVNNANPVDNLSLGELKKLFLGDRSRWDTGKAVAPVMPPRARPNELRFLGSFAE